MGLVRALSLMLLTTPLMASGSYTSRDTGTKPLFRFHLDEREGLAATSRNPDFVGVVNGAPWVQGRFGTALRFQSVLDILFFSDVGFPTGNATPWTFSAWVKVVPPGIAGMNYIFSYGNITDKAHWYIGGAGGTNYKVNINPGGGSQTSDIVTMSSREWTFLYVRWLGGDPGVISIAAVRNGVAYRDRLTFSGINISLSGTAAVGNSASDLTQTCNCIIDDPQFFSGNEGLGTVWASYWRGIAAGHR